MSPSEAPCGLCAVLKMWRGGKEVEPDEEELRLKQIWETLDADGSGLLSVDETRIVIGAMGKVPHDAQHFSQ